ncbi:MAG: EAL domain-containing protein [Eubacterium sp.]|nr:EAL domain-containing protein [Eubacterium sp.]
MANSKEKSFRKIKRSYTWLSVVTLVFVLIISAALINGALVFFTLYSVNSKVDNQYEYVKSMASIYEKSSDRENASLRDVLINECPNFVVLDKNRNDIDGHGINSCSDVGGHLGFLYADRDYVVYEDTDDTILEFKSIGWFQPDLWLLRDEVMDSLGADKPDPDEMDPGFEEDNSLDSIDKSEIVDMPVWMETGLSNGNRFIVKTNIQIRALDVVVFVIVAACLNMILLIITIAWLIRIIRGIIRRKKTEELFLVDEVTRSNNWMGFLLNGERILKKGKNADKRYAMIHLVIVKYRNYCMCHSLEEGRRILFNISSLINRTLKPKSELSAHVSSSSFVILIEAENGDEVKFRFDRLLESLKNADMQMNTPRQPGHSDTFHTFNFQAGVQYIEPNIIDGKKKKRKTIDIEQYYNNAVTAKSTLEVTDDDGIAFFDSKLMEDERWVDMVEEHQQKALDNEEFIVYYQPKYSPDKAELIGAEALIRWQSPDFGFVPPGRFIPVFEKNGFITSIDHYMICHVAADQKRWLDAGMECVPVSVNVSRAHFAEPDLAEQIRNMVDSVGTPHEYIEIELTESAFFDDKNAIIDTIERLKSYGFSVSMDDFGSGYSSLNSLKDMNLDVLKLDAEFFRGNADPDRKEAVVSEAIKLAKRLNMRTVAEGVEDKDEVEFLKKQGCDMIQGYYFAKPMPGDEYEERMKEKYHMPEED